MPATFFTTQPTRQANFIRNTESHSLTSACYYKFKNYSIPKDPSESELVICRNEAELSTTIITPRLVFRSCNQIDKNDLMQGLREIFMNPVNVRQYLDGQAWSEEQIDAYIQKYSLAWEQGKKFSVYAIYDVLNPDKIIGTLDLCEYTALADYENTITLGYILLMSEHGRKIGREIGEVSWQVFMHEIGAAIAAGEIPYKGLIATAHPDNIASVSILKHILGDAVPDVKLSYGPNQPRNLFFRPYKPINFDVELTQTTDFMVLDTKKHITH